MDVEMDGVQLENPPDDGTESEGGQKSQLPDSVGDDAKQKTKSGLKGLASGFKNMIPSGRQGNEEGTEAGIETGSKSGLKSLTAGLKNPFAGIGRRDETEDGLEQAGIEDGTKNKSFMSGLKNSLPGIGIQNADETTDAVTEAGTEATNATGLRGRLSRMVSTVNPSVTEEDVEEMRNPASRPVIDKREAEQTISNGFNNKKTLANGLMDFAFLTANANQLHYAITASRVVEDDRIASIVLISTSIFFQLIVGILLIWKSYIQSKPVNELNDRQVIITKNNDRIRVINVIDHITIALVFMIAILNIFIASFSISQQTDKPTEENSSSVSPIDSYNQ